jgi:hypothetical protein
MLSWSVRHLVSLLAALFVSVWHRLSRMNPANRSAHDPGVFYLVVDSLTAFGHPIVYLFCWPLPLSIRKEKIKADIGLSPEDA